MAMRVRCAENLRLIGQAINAYSNNENQNGLAFPRVKFSIPDMDRPTFFTDGKQPHSFGEGAPVNDVTASFYLIFKTQDLKPQVLVCPATTKQPMSFGDERPAPAHPLAASKTDLCNFPSMDYVSYSIQNMFPSVPAYPADGSGTRRFGGDVILGDLNPGGRAVTTVKPNSAPGQLAAANSPNHGRVGRMCSLAICTLIFDHALLRRQNGRWHTGQHLLPPGRAAGDPIVGPPMDRLDSVLLPSSRLQTSEMKLF